MIVCMHEATSAAFDFRAAMEGYARAGVRAVEPDLIKALEFERKESKGAARALLDDLGLTAVSSSNQILLEAPGPARAQSLEDLKWKLEMAESIGADRLVAPSLAEGDYSAVDYDEVVANLSEAAEIAQSHGIVLMLEFTRNSKLVSTLRTALDIVRRASHPNLKAMLDTYHFWAGRSKFEDLALLEVGELHHLHFEDVPSVPPVEVFALKDRAFPGEGIAPLGKILNALRDKGYEGPASFETFDPVVQATDPYEVGCKARNAIERFL